MPQLLLDQERFFEANEYVGWRPVSVQNTTVQRSTAYAHQGVASVLSTIVSLTGITHSRDLHAKLSRPLLGTIEGNEYTFSGWFMATAGTPIGATIELDFLTSSGDLIQRFTEAPFGQGMVHGTWNFIALVVSSAPAAYQILPRCGFSGGLTLPAPNHYFDEMSLTGTLIVAGSGSPLRQRQNRVFSSRIRHRVY